MPMGRMKKLLLAGMVLVVGIVLAWPFRKTGSDSDMASRVAVAELSPSESQPPAKKQHVVAKMAGWSRAEKRESPVTSSVDLAGHPAFRGSAPVEPPHVPSTYQPDLTVGVGATGTVGENAPARAGYGDDSTPLRRRNGLLHIVSDGDTLERLAERYLRDSGRALEIFDLNRDRLTNPHLLQIGVELRIPPHLSRDVD